MTKTKKITFFQRRIVVWICALICCALWGSAFPCIKLGYSLFAIDSSDTASVILFAGVRFAGAGVLTLVFGSIGARKLLLPKITSWGRIIVLCMFQTVIQYLFFYIGLAHTTGVKGSILQGTGTLFAILFSCLLFRNEKMTAFKVAGCIIGFAGLILANLTGSGLSPEFALNGEGFLIISSVSYALSSNFMSRFGTKESPVMLSGWQFLTGGLILCAFGYFSGGALNTITKEGALLLLYMMFLSAAAYTLWGVLLKHNPVSRVSVFGFAIPAFGSIFSALLLNEAESLSAATLISLILVCIGIFLVNKAKKKA